MKIFLNFYTKHFCFNTPLFCPLLTVFTTKSKKQLRLSSIILSKPVIYYRAFLYISFWEFDYWFLTCWLEPNALWELLRSQIRILRVEGGQFEGSGDRSPLGGRQDDLILTMSPQELPIYRNQQTLKQWK